jgi:dTDP-4-dehydrorhamnose reductase
MKVLVIGREGQLALSLVERAKGRAGIELSAAGRPDLDLEVPRSAARAIAAARPDIIINAAAYTAVDQAEDEPERAFRINGEAAGEVAVAAADLGAILIHISTDYVFDGRARSPYREDALPNPLGVYGRSKLAGEEQVRAAAGRHIILRTAWVYSPFGSNFVKSMVAAAGKGRPLTVVDDQYGSPTSAFDLADALLRVIDRWQSDPATGLGQTFHLAATGSTSWCGFARTIMDECARVGAAFVEVKPIASADWPVRAPRPAYSVLDSSKIARIFGARPREWQAPVREVIKRLVAMQQSSAGDGPLAGLAAKAGGKSTKE